MNNSIITNWKTTLLGLISVVLLLLVNTGVITPNDSQELNGLLSKIVENVNEIITFSLAIALFFSKDADKK